MAARQLRYTKSMLCSQWHKSSSPPTRKSVVDGAPPKSIQPTNRDRQSDRQTDKQTDRQTDSHTYRQKDSRSDRQTYTDKQINDQTDTHTQKQTDKQKDRQICKQLAVEESANYIHIVATFCC